MMKASHLTVETSASSQLGKRAASGVAWMLVLNMAGRLGALLSQLVLARLLIPEDFGVIGLAYTFISFFTALTNFGVEDIFQQRRSGMYLWTTQAFVLSLGAATIGAIAMAICSPIAASVFHDARVANVIRILAISLPLTALSTVPQARLKSALQFRFVAIYGVVELIVSQFATIVLAWCGWGALSFAAPVPVLAAVRALIMWYKASIPLRPLDRAKGWNRMLARATSVLGLTVMIACIQQGDYFILGIFSTPHVVGIYFFAFKLAAMPMLMLASNFNSVLRPTLILLHGDAERQRNMALRTAELLGLLTVPLCFMQAALAGPGLTLLVGTRWSEAIPLIQILSIGLPLDAVAWPAGSLLEARGKFSTSLRYQLVSAPFFFIFVFIGALAGGAIGVAIGVTTYYILHPIYLTIVVFRDNGVSIGRILSCFYAPVLLAGLPIWGAYAISKLSIFHDKLILQMCIITLTGGAGYLIALRGFLPEFYFDLRNRFIQLYNK
jgi:O-antigen/teichoic acid export membrane protein